MSLTDEQLVVACRNIGYDLTCGACAAVFYTGTGMITDEHTCSGTHRSDPQRFITPGGAVCEMAPAALSSSPAKPQVILGQSTPKPGEPGWAMIRVVTLRQLLREVLDCAIPKSTRDLATGMALGLDYRLTHSCYDPAGDGAACGRCDSCHLRRAGFRDAGLPDPTRYAPTAG